MDTLLECGVCITHLDTWLTHQLRTTWTQLGINNLKERKKNQTTSIESMKKRNPISQNIEAKGASYAV